MTPNVPIRPVFYQNFLRALGSDSPLPSPNTTATPVQIHWHLGSILTQEEQWNQWDKKQKQASWRALTLQLSQDLGKPISTANLHQMQRLFRAFPDAAKLRPELSWTHYQLLLRIKDGKARLHYLRAAADHHWSAEQLARQVKSDAFGRKLAKPTPSNNVDTDSPAAPISILKDPYLFEFISGPSSEKALLDSLLAHLPAFLLELGPGFAFVACQKRLCTPSGKQFFIDLALYHHIRKCHVLIDFKTKELTHGDIGQMDMYLRLFDDLCRQSDDQPTIGLLLCAHIDPTISQYSILQTNDHLYASRYRFNAECKMADG